MGKMDSLLLKSKFRGTMLGVLLGDCLGSAYEGEELFSAGMKLVIQNSIDKLEGPHYKAPVMQFTDDTAMTYAVAESLIERQGFDQQDMAKKFVKTYYQEPHRGYGAGVTTVFQKLRQNKFVDVLGPAREQFNGEGSLGNGGAMRVSPVALFCYKNFDLMVDVARKQSQITHTHKTGVDGAILQAIAIQQSLLLDPKETLDVCKFTDDLIEKMNKIEVDEEGLGLGDPSPYKTQLKLVKDLIREKGDGPHDEKVVHQLGNDVSALHSVPTAIFCFLKAQRPIKDIQTENPLRRTIQYAKINCNNVQSIGYNRGNKIPTDAGECCSQWKTSLAEQIHCSLLEKETKYCPPPMLQLHFRPNMQPPLSNYWYPNADTNQLKPGVQFNLSSDSLLSETSSSTIVCERKSNYTCTPKKSVTECGVQCKSSDSKQTMSVYCDISSVRKETTDMAIAVEYDVYDDFAKTIACQLRAMDAERALQVQNQIDKVITDYRLYKPETIGLGGDTDTIGSMAGAIAGAFYGEELISPEILRHCEISDEIRDLADRLFDLASA